MLNTRNATSKEVEVEVVVADLQVDHLIVHTDPLIVAMEVMDIMVTVEQ